MLGATALLENPESETVMIVIRNMLVLWLPVKLLTGCRALAKREGLTLRRWIENQLQIIVDSNSLP